MFDLGICLITCQNALISDKRGKRIPVPTGQIICQLISCFDIKVQPRAYGADQLEHFHGFLVWGSSPCIRGGSDRCHIIFCHHRLIPVYMGRIPVSSTPLINEWAHPRVYGADVLPMPFFCPPWGSSPCVRGRY